MEMIDFRSDTVSHPTQQMREAMATAVVGDDVYGEDPTVNRLQAEAAELFGKQAGLFVSSGTQGNLISVMVHAGRGDEIILGDKAHIFRYEAGGAAGLAGVQPHTIPVQPDGTLELDAIRGAIRGDNEHFPRTKLICLENTQNAVGGQPLSVEYTQQVARIARENKLKLHIDGARIFNAAAYFDVPVRDLATDADSLTFCLSKGLSAPVGSVLVGSHDFIREARRARKMLGGGMRQAGILAAAGLVALHEMPRYLAQDHAHARVLAQGLTSLPHIHLDVDRVKTNMVFFELAESAPISPEAFTERLRAECGIQMRPYPGHRRLFRAVTHYWIRPDHIETALDAIRTLLS
jgi:threonine aldolase